MEKLFGTDGVRGKANEYPITPEIFRDIGRATTHLLGGKGDKPRILVGKDTRMSGHMLENALSDGICSMGGNVLRLSETFPTPGIAFLTRELKADAGMAISASHNPYYDNGIKIISREGFKLPDETEGEIEKLVLSGKCAELPPSGHGIGNVRFMREAEDIYANFLKGTFPNAYSLKGMKVVLDCANGATCAIAPGIFSELGARVFAYFTEPDGRNINQSCGSLYPGVIAEKVVEHGADIGLAFDGDGDRVTAVDETGKVLTGDQILAICAIARNEEGTLKNNLLVSTVMSNIGLKLAMQEQNIEHAISQVGDRYVLEQMLKRDAVLGGEDSGHIIFLDLHTTGDGMLSALQLITAMKKEGKSLSALSRIMTVYPQELINVPVKEKPALTNFPEITRTIRKIENVLGHRGRVFVRYSGTEPICRVMVEGPSQEQTERYCREIADVIQALLG